MNQLKYVVLVAMLLAAAGAQADRYYTWVDETGRVRYTQIPQDKSSSPAPDQAGSGISGDPSANPSAPLSLEDYIDAEELQKRGYVRPDEDARFYTWVDHNGIIHNSPYPPAAVEVAPDPKGLAQKISPFLQVERLRPSASVVGEADDFAKRLFQLDQAPKGRLAALSEHCCKDLSATQIYEIDLEDGQVLEFTADSERYPFATGESAYQLVRLPASSREYLLRIRSFVKGEVFYPALVFLDNQFEPQRLVSNVVFDFTPENWFRYGYLEGRVVVEPQKESYLLVLTLKEDLHRQTLVKRKNRDVPAKHSQQGLLHISVDRGD